MKATLMVQEGRRWEMSRTYERLSMDKGNWLQRSEYCVLAL